jgi:hypothetical protein
MLQIETFIGVSLLSIAHQFLYTVVFFPLSAFGGSETTSEAAAEVATAEVATAQAATAEAATAEAATAEAATAHLSAPASEEKTSVKANVISHSSGLTLLARRCVNRANNNPITLAKESSTGIRTGVTPLVVKQAHLSSSTEAEDFWSAKTVGKDDIKAKQTELERKPNGLCDWLAKNRAADDAWVTAFHCIESDRSPA